MSLEKSLIEVKPGSPKSFGFVFSAAFAVWGLYPLIGGAGPRLWSLGICIGFLVVALARPSLLKWPNYWWFRFGMLLGRVVAPIVMGAVYILTILPLGLVMRVIGRDALHRKYDENASTYWIERTDAPQPMKLQF